MQRVHAFSFHYVFISPINNFTKDLIPIGHGENRTRGNQNSDIVKCECSTTLQGSRLSPYACIYVCVRYNKNSVITMILLLSKNYAMAHRLKVQIKVKRKRRAGDSNNQSTPSLTI